MIIHFQVTNNLQYTNNANNVQLYRIKYSYLILIIFKTDLFNP